MNEFNPYFNEEISESYTYDNAKAYNHDNNPLITNRVVTGEVGNRYDDISRVDFLIVRDAKRVTETTMVQHLCDISRSLALLCDLENEKIVALRDLFLLIRDKEFGNEYHD